jgi:hypothetical protein
MVPEDREEWPSLGGQVCDWIEANLCFGPGDLRGEPAVIDDEKRALIWRMYEVFPKGHRQAGRRRFRRVGISLPKGTAKTELAAWIAAAELHPEGPVRCVGWKGKSPIGGPVTDPFVVLVAYTEEQSDELAYGALRTILEESACGAAFDIGLERILRKSGDGKAVSLAGSPNARDGARTTFQVFDETHWHTLPRLKQAHQTMMANLPKRKASDAWALEITTAPQPGAGSIAEDTMEYAQQVADGKIADAALLFFHRQASDGHDLSTPEGARAAVIEASGASAAWRDIDGIVALRADPTMDPAYWERVYCNRLVKGSTQAFDVVRFKALAKSGYTVKPGALIVLGFDGALFHDSVALVGTEIETGYQWVAGLWEKPTTPRSPDAPEWKAPEAEIDARVRELFAVYTVWRMYADPPYWQSWIAAWRGAFTEERVIEWWTHRRVQMRNALEGFDTAIKSGLLSHDGSPDLARHIGNARRSDLPQLDDQGKKLWLIQKERPDSVHKIDAAVAATLSWEARTDAVAAGFGAGNIYLERGVVSLSAYL